MFESLIDLAIGGVFGEDAVLMVKDQWLYPGPTARLLLEMGFRAAILLLVALLLSYFLRKDDATVRHGMWRLTMVAALLLPTLGTFAPRWQVPLVPLHAVAPPMSPQTAPLVGDPLRPETLRPSTPDEAAAAGVTVQETVDQGLLQGDVGRGLLVIWSAGTLLALLWLAIGVVRLHLLVGGGTRYAPHDRMASLVAARIGLRRTPSVMHHATLRTPITFGTLRPRILLPAAAVGWSEERLRVVLLHEMMHVQRHDAFHQLLALVVRALYWPIPFAWAAVDAVARERELACDERVVATGERPSDYASHLLAVARQTRLPSAAMAMAAPSRLEERVLSILRPERPRSALAATGVVATTLLLALPTLAGVDPWAVQSPLQIADDGRVHGWSDDYLRLELQRGDELAATKDFEALKAHYRRVLRATPHVPIAWFRLGYAEIVTGDLEAGIEASRRAARYSGFRPSALYNLACAHSMRGEIEQALEAFELAVDSGGFRLSADAVRADADLEPLHGVPRFEKALERID